MRSNFFWMLLGNLTFAACRWGWFIALAKLGAPQAAGAFAFALACASPLFMLTNLQLRQLQSVGACAHAVFADFVALRLAGIVCALAAAGAIAAASPQPASGLVLALALAKAAEGCSDLVYGRLQRQEAMRPVGLSLMVRGGLGLAFFAAPLLLGGSVLLATAGLALGWILTFLLLDLASLRRAPPETERRDGAAAPRFVPRWSGCNLRVLFACGWPLGVVMMLISLVGQLPVYFLTAYRGQGETGVFAMLFCFFAGQQIIVVSLGQTAGPRLARCFAQGDYAGFRATLGNSLAIASGVCGACWLGAWFGGEEVLSWLYAPEYARHASLLAWLMAAAWVGNVSSLLASALTAAQAFHVQMLVFGGVVLALLVACWAFVPLWGLPGAILALAIASLVQAAAAGAALNRRLRRLQAPPRRRAPRPLDRAA